MKFNIKQAAKAAALAIAPLAATAINPLFGLLVGSSIASGGVAKAIGQQEEKKTGIRPHKVSAPLAAAAAPALLVGTGVVDIGPICDLVIRACEHEALIGGALGMAVVFWHQLVGGFGKIKPD